MFFTSIVTLVSCIFYVVGTYISDKYAVVVVTVEACFAAVFFMDYVLSVMAEAVSCREALRSPVRLPPPPLTCVSVSSSQSYNLGTLNERGIHTRLLCVCSFHR